MAGGYGDSVPRSQFYLPKPEWTTGTFSLPSSPARRFAEGLVQKPVAVSTPTVKQLTCQHGLRGVEKDRRTLTKTFWVQECKEVSGKTSAEHELKEQVSVTTRDKKYGLCRILWRSH